MNDPLRQAATAIRGHFRLYAEPFSGFLIAPGIVNGKVAVFCRRHPSDEDRGKCRELANGADIEFVVSRDRPCDEIGSNTASR